VLSRARASRPPFAARASICQQSSRRLTVCHSERMRARRLRLQLAYLLVSFRPLARLELKFRRRRLAGARTHVDLLLVRGARRPLFALPLCSALLCKARLGTPRDPKGVGKTP